MGNHRAGSVAHADPAADYPAAGWSLSKRRFACARRKASGRFEASEFFLDAFTTAIEPGEIVVAIEIAARGGERGLQV